MLAALILFFLTVQCKAWLSPMPSTSSRAMESAVVLIDPVTDWKQVIEAAASLGHSVIAVQLPAETLPEKFQSFLPTALALREAGVDHVLSVEQRDTFQITQQLQIIASDCNLKLVGVIPLSEIAVEVSDCVGKSLKVLIVFSLRSNTDMVSVNLMILSVPQYFSLQLLVWVFHTTNWTA